MENEGMVPMHAKTAKSDEIIAAVGDGVTVHDLDFRIIYQNQTMKSIFGDCVGKLCYEAYKQLPDVCPGCPVAACFSSGEVHTVERIVSIADKSFVFETCASPIRDKNGAIVAAVEVVRNATVRKEAEERITRLKNLYNALSRTNN
jgi:PAS domain-containing protein